MYKIWVDRSEPKFPDGPAGMNDWYVSIEDDVFYSPTWAQKHPDAALPVPRVFTTVRKAFHFMQMVLRYSKVPKIYHRFRVERVD